MEDFDQLENKRDFRKMILVIVGVVVVAGAITTFLLFKKGSKNTFDSDTQDPNVLNSELETKEKSLFSKDITTWKNYYWPGKINTHYPSDWQLVEDINNDGLVVGLKITPLASNVEDVIFIGGDSIKCSDISKYSKNECLKNKIQIPFYTNSKNEDVLSAFDLIFQNTVLTEEEK